MVLLILTLDGAIKLLFIALLSPLWLPVAKALWNDAQDALREEGGIFGRPPTAGELKRLEAEKGAYQTPLLHVLREDGDPAAQPGSGRNAAARPPRQRGQTGPRGWRNR